MGARSIAMLLLLPVAGPWALGGEMAADPREAGVSSWEAPSYEQAAWMRDRATAYTCQGEMTKGLGYIKSKCPDSVPFGNDNVMVGEFGITARDRWQDRLSFVRGRLDEIRAMNGLFSVEWELADARRGLVMPKWQGGLKRPFYYYYCVGCHLLDDRLVIDDFEADELGLKATATTDST